MTNNSSVKRSRWAVGRHQAIWLGGLIWLGLCSYTLLHPLSSQSDPIPVFVWHDLAIVCLASAFPLAFLLAKILCGIQDGSVTFLGSALCLFPALLQFLTNYSGVHSDGGLENLPLSSNLILFSVWWQSLVWVLPAAWLTMLALSDFKFVPNFAWGCVTLMISVFLPATYLHGRCQYDLVKLDELIQQSRIGEASSWASRIALIAPAARVGNRPLRQVQRALDQKKSELTRQLSESQNRSVSDQIRIEQARCLAMLGRRSEALRCLDEADFVSAETLNLKGLIYETQDDWRAAEASYQLAYERLTALNDRNHPGFETPDGPKSSVHMTSMQQALQGLGYCQHKQGRYATAEKSYRQLLELSPTADVCFLLAQFYDDTQQTSLAHRFAKQASRLDPVRFKQASHKLITKISQEHFGCFGVYYREFRQ